MHVVEYDGRGIGYEQVSVDGVVIRGSHYWFVPRFEFKVGGLAGTVEIRVWPWLTLRSLILRLGDIVIYAEGTYGEKKQVNIPHEWEDFA